jgi:hypothetical protein
VTRFWKALTETSDVYELVSAIGQATEFQTMVPARTGPSDALCTLEKAVEAELGPRWVRIRQQLQRAVGELDARRDSLILLFAHLLRLPVVDPALQKRRSSPKLTCYVQSDHTLFRTSARSSANPKPSQRPPCYYDCTQLVTAHNRNYAFACVLCSRYPTWFARRTMGTITRSEE